MQIIHRVDNFLFTLFPEISGGGNELLINALEKYYTYGVFKPKVSIDNNFILIDISTLSKLSIINFFKIDE